MKNFIYLVMVMAACQSPVVFDDTYPKDVEALDAIPEVYEGVYMCESDSTIITINGQHILALEFNFFEESVQDMNRRVGCTLIEDEVYIDAIEDCIPIEYIGEDSIRGQYTTVDTLWKLSPYNEVKPYKGSLVLNQRIDKGEVIISFLSLDSYGNVFYRAINENSDLDAISEITDMEEIEVDRNSEPIYKIKPNRKEFDELFENEEIFIVCEYLMRVNLEEFPNYIF
ncbi:hypothetical protein [Portibacter marinus]|uniref:hypothetical protein n=1 Tax=Portibacter marinus TaxID=2898660 RepID=UPI001F35962E|nr:hypothetical protein [Portibacter marinus]